MGFANTKFSFSSNMFEGMVYGHGDMKNLGELECYGDTLQDCLDSATIGVSDWNGNECQHIDIGELDTPNYEAAVIEITKAYAARDAAIASITEVAQSSTPLITASIFTDIVAAITGNAARDLKQAQKGE